MKTIIFYFNQELDEIINKVTHTLLVDTKLDSDELAEMFDPIIKTMENKYGVFDGGGVGDEILDYLNYEFLEKDFDKQKCIDSTTKVVNEFITKTSKMINVIFNSYEYSVEHDEYEIEESSDESYNNIINNITDICMKMRTAIKEFVEKEHGGNFDNLCFFSGNLLISGNKVFLTTTFYLGLWATGSEYKKYGNSIDYWSIYDAVTGSITVGGASKEYYDKLSKIALKSLNEDMMEYYHCSDNEKYLTLNTREMLSNKDGLYIKNDVSDINDYDYFNMSQYFNFAFSNFINAMKEYNSPEFRLKSLSIKEDDENEFIIEYDGINSIIEKGGFYTGGSNKAYKNAADEYNFEQIIEEPAYLIWRDFDKVSLGLEPDPNDDGGVIVTKMTLNTDGTLTSTGPYKSYPNGKKEPIKKDDNKKKFDSSKIDLDW